MHQLRGMAPEPDFAWAVLAYSKTNVAWITSSRGNSKRWEGKRASGKNVIASRYTGTWPTTRAPVRFIFRCFKPGELAAVSNSPGGSRDCIPICADWMVHCAKNHNNREQHKIGSDHDSASTVLQVDALVWLFPSTTQPNQFYTTDHYCIR